MYPFLSTTFTSAPYQSNYYTAGKYPLSTATVSGESPSLFGTLIVSVPYFNSAYTTSAWPANRARIKGVRPLLSTAFTFALY